MSDEILERIVPVDAPNDRLDRAVSRLFGVSRGRAMEWIADDRVRVDGRRAPKGAQVGPGARVSVRRPPPESPVPQPELPIRIVHADAHLVVADKRAGMPCDAAVTWRPYPVGADRRSRILEPRPARSI